MFRWCQVTIDVYRQRILGKIVWRKIILCFVKDLINYALLKVGNFKSCISELLDDTNCLINMLSTTMKVKDFAGILKPKKI